MHPKLKVLQVIPKLGYGGAETGCYDIAHYLHENECKSFLICNGGELTKFIDKKKVKVLIFAEDVAASGGYFIACAGDEIFANSRQAIARRIFPEKADSTGVKVFTKGSNVEVTKFKSWQIAPSNPY